MLLLLEREWKKCKFNCYFILSELCFKPMPWSFSQYVIKNLFPDSELQNNLSKQV